MAECPVCGTSLLEPIPPVCEQCGWDLGNDITLVTSGHEIPQGITKNYQKRVEIAKRNWDERLQAIARQKELEKKLAEQEASEKQSASEYEFIKKCRESNDPAGSYREYLSKYLEGVYRIEAEQALKEQVGTKPLKSKNDSYKERMYPAVCSECGTVCEVPFEPTENTPIYCTLCYYARIGAENHPAVCALCGTECKVPFEPTDDSPVYCFVCEETEGVKNEKEYDKRTKGILILGSVNTKSAKEWKNLGDKAEDPDEKILYKTNAIEIDSHFALFGLRGAAYYEKGRYDFAIWDYTDAIELNPDFEQAYYLRGLAYAKQGKAIEAQRDFEKSEELKRKMKK